MTITFGDSYEIYEDLETLLLVLQDANPKLPLCDTDWEGSFTCYHWVSSKRPGGIRCTTEWYMDQEVNITKVILVIVTKPQLPCITLHDMELP